MTNWKRVAVDAEVHAISSHVAPEPTPPLVRRIVVKQLHGRTDYDLTLVAEASSPRSAPDSDRLALLYGENGSGKTTILRLLWDILSPAPNRGHRNRIASVAFSEFTVFLDGGLRISASRKLPAVGPYEIVTQRKSRILSRSSWPEEHPFEDFFNNLTVDELNSQIETLDPQLGNAGREVLAQRVYLETLASLGAAPYFLADDRSTSSDEIPKDELAKRSRLTIRELSQDSPAETRGLLARELERSIERVNATLRTLALGANVSGSANANSVYVEVLRQFSAFPPETSEQPGLRAEIIERVNQVGVRSRGFETLGLIPRFVSAEFSKPIRLVADEHLPVVRSIVEPYLQSLSARLDALQESQTLIQTFLDEANRFLSDKELTYLAPRGLRIQLLNGDQLLPPQLSSGECHLLLLLCNAILARGNARVFLIDEPELSLNVKWQRRIVGALLACTAGSGLQFILATHSIELLAGYRPAVVRLSGDDER